MIVKDGRDLSSKNIKDKHDWTLQKLYQEKRHQNIVIGLQRHPPLVSTLLVTLQNENPSQQNTI